MLLFVASLCNLYTCRYRLRLTVIILNLTKCKTSLNKKNTKTEGTRSVASTYKTIPVLEVVSMLHLLIS